MATYDLTATATANIIDPLIRVMAKADAALRQELELKMAGLGSRVGAAATYDALPAVDQNGKAVTSGDSATLTETDGANPSGLYIFDGNVWQLEINYDDLGVSAMKEDIMDGSLTVDALTGVITGDGDAVDGAQLKTALENYKTFMSTQFHVKGGATDATFIAPLANEGTDEVVVAKQLAMLFTEVEAQALYDAV